MTSRQTRRRAPVLKVLMFHGLARELPAYAVYAGTRTCIIRACDFESCVEWCTRTHKLIMLRDLPQYLRGEASEPAVLLTFDDGLASVIDLAVPVLKKHHATAVLFVTTGWVDSQAAPAIFSLERDLWETPPERLTMQAPGYEFSAAVGRRGAVAGVMASLWAFCLAHRIPPVSLAPEWVRFDGRRWQPDPARQDRHGWFPANWDDIAAAARDGVLEIGAHGATHTPWPWLSEQQRRREIGDSRERLQHLTSGDVSACAYPHGMYDDAARAEVRKHYACAFTTQGRIVADDPDDLLPRFHVPSERPVAMDLIVRWPLAGRLLRKGVSMVGDVLS